MTSRDNETEALEAAPSGYDPQASKADISDPVWDFHGAAAEATWSYGTSRPAEAGVRRLEAAVSRYLVEQHMPSLAFWVESAAPTGRQLRDLCDTLYALYLVGRGDEVTERAKRDFVRVIAEKRFPGDFTPGRERGANVHLTAYALGVLNLLRVDSDLLRYALFRKDFWNVGELIDLRKTLPRWPACLNHHSWRVGRCIGGTLSIVQSLWGLCGDLAAANSLPPIEHVLWRCDDLIDGETGLLRAYKSAQAQKAFRAIYKLKHDPDVANLSGVAHVHWINYATDRVPYKAAGALHERAWKILQRSPFIERVPSCLDFDIMQIVRTSLPHNAERKAALANRARQLMEDIREFYTGGLDASYALHKLPGGLAALHECAMAAGNAVVPGIGTAPVDIIKEAYWL